MGCPPPPRPNRWTGRTTCGRRPTRTSRRSRRYGTGTSYPYPFVAGQVDASSFPRLPWLRALREALEPAHLHDSLRDGVDEDDPMLVAELCRHVLPARGIEADPRQVLVTLGSQQGLDLLANAVVRPGSVVGVENPGYLDARRIFLRAGARLSADRGRRLGHGPAGRFRRRLGGAPDPEPPQPDQRHLVHRPATARC